MKKITPALANKMIKKLEDDKGYLLDHERRASMFDPSEYYVDIEESNNPDEPQRRIVAPPYDYFDVEAKLAAIDEKVAYIKHAINESNVKNQLLVDEEAFSVDVALIRLAQLNKRIKVLDQMRRRLPGLAEDYDRSYRKQLANYNPEDVNEDYQAYREKIMKLQMALDKYNHTVELELDI